MAKSELAGKVQTVLGVIESRDLGITLPHEHLLIDGRVSFIEPDGASDRALAHKPVSLEILSWLRYHPFENQDNCCLLDEQDAIDETMLYKQAGGGTIVDVTNIGIGRDPKALVRISQATGLNVIMGAGYYVAATHPPEMSLKTEEEITEEIVRDITLGAGDSGIRAGIIGEIGGSWPLQDNEKKVMRAAAHAQQRTGASVSIHLGRSEKAALEICEVLADAGANLSRVIMSHIDVRIREHSMLRKVAEKGCCLEYDLWGWEGNYPWWIYDFDLPNDMQRIYDLLYLIDEGYLNQILVSHDICKKNQLVRYGGWGYAHISNYVVPTMLKRGMTREQINAIMVENPKRLLCFV